MPDGSIECVLGQLQVNMEHVLDELRNAGEEAKSSRAEIKSTVDELDRRMREVENVILSARSSWKTIVTLGSTAALIVAGVWTLFQTFHDSLSKIWKVLTNTL